MKKSYISPSILIELMNFGYQGKMISRLWDEEDVDAGFVLLNTIAAKFKMYPEVPFTPFSHFDIADTAMIVMGGLPKMGQLEHWEGEGYSYDSKSKIITKFHDCIALENASGWVAQQMNPANDKILANGVLMMHDVLSTTKEHLKECQIAWEPFIWLALREIVIDNPRIPVVFTTHASHAKFKNAVTAAKHVFNIILQEDKPLVSNGALSVAERLSRDISSPGFKLDLLKDSKL